LDTEVRYHRELVAIDGDLARPYPSLDRLENSTLYIDADKPYLSAESYLSDDHAFYIDEENDLIYLRSTKDPNSSKIEVGKRDGLLSISGNYVVLKGITFKHDASFENSFSSISGEAVSLSGKYLLVEDCNMIDNGSDGIVFSPGSDLLVRRGDFSNNGRIGIGLRRTYTRAYFEGINVSYNHWRSDLGHYTAPDLSGFGKVMFSNRIYLENSTIQYHKNTGIWFDAQNMDITLDNCYFTQNNGALWFEINALNLGLINSSVYDNNVVGVRLDSESIYLYNNVMSQSSLDGAWGVLATLYYPKREGQIVPDVYMAKWLTLKSNIIAVSSGSGKIMRYDNSDIIGATATSTDNIFYASPVQNRIYTLHVLSFTDWQNSFNDTTSQLVDSYPFINDASATVSFKDSSISVDENQTTLQIPIVLSKAVDANISVDLTVSGGIGATENDDFKVLNGDKVIFRPLERKKYVTVIVNRDYEDEALEEFTLTLSNPINASLGIHDVITVAINASNEVLTQATQKIVNAYNRIEAENPDDYYEINFIDNVGFGRFRKNHWAMYSNVDFGVTSPTTVEVSIAVPEDGDCETTHLVSPLKS